MIDLRVIHLDKNMGHGVARRRGLCECKNSLVALMDADDISLTNRFELQLRAFTKNQDLSIVGGQIAEFIGTQDNITGIRLVPELNDDIKLYLKKRCPMNQVTVMFKKEDIEKVGGYIDWYCEEDYYLWARMAIANCMFYNLPNILVNVRVGDEMSERRGGLKYFFSEAKMQHFLFKNNLINIFRYMYNLAIRFGGEVVVPSKLRVKLFKLFRKDIKKIEKSEVKYDIELSKNYNYPPFSVSMCVYGGDNALWFDEALNSVVYQTVKPQEIVLVVDGPINDELTKVIEKYKTVCSL